jgi:hypothetical protein
VVTTTKVDESEKERGRERKRESFQSFGKVDFSRWKEKEGMGNTILWTGRWRRFR